ncbi:MAG TPA: nucleotidyltransferase domain-containing protein, partial [Cytophagales bacterium]|nr:nucleotidyltransferase domain-containing protein [Cytophagales bacterium]
MESFVSDLRAEGYTPAHVLLFGSYAKGPTNQTSDIDLAIWDERF